ncbi:MAG: hypothetical protein VW239_04755 [Candidatus Nanopelagicales bacterium]
MANAIYTLNANQTDRVVFDDSGTIINFRVRPPTAAHAGETVEVDLADSAQDAAFDESKYTLAGASFSHKVKPSA